VKAPLWSRTLDVLGLVGMLIGALDPLEGAPIILLGTGLAATGAVLGKSRYQNLLCWSFCLVALGVGAGFLLSMWGGFRMWWVLVVPYPAGWIIGLVGIILTLVESARHPAPPA
jgi:hypothetical protein